MKPIKVEMPHKTWYLYSRESGRYFAMHYCDDCPHAFLGDECSGAQIEKCRNKVIVALNDLLAELDK